MNPRIWRALGCLLGAVFLYASFLIGANWSDDYMLGYGTFLLSRGELALKLYLLVFMLPAALLLSVAIAGISSASTRYTRNAYSRPRPTRSSVALN